jgi:hypothetical protein
VDEAPRRRATAFAERLASRCASALGEQLVAAILHGSLTLGDFTPGRGDVDLLLVVERPLSDDEIDALRAAVEVLGEPADSRVDLRVVTRQVASSPSPAPAMEAYVALAPSRPAAVETRVAAEPDLAVELSVVRAHGRSILGPEPSALVGVVPPEWLVAIGDRYLADWERLTDDAAHAELMVLTACRIWRFSAERVHCSKSEAGRWALDRDPSLTAVREALRQRQVDPETKIGQDGIQHLIALVRREIASR